MKLHITPIEMGKMYFYDIMLLYKKYEEFVNEQNEADEKRQAEYNEQDGGNISDYTSSMNSKVDSMINKIGSITPQSITSGFNFPH